MSLSVRMHRPKRSHTRFVPRLYGLAIGVSWLLLLAGYGFSIAPAFAVISPIAAGTLLAVGVASSAIWLNGIRHLVMWATGPLWARRMTALLERHPAEPLGSTTPARVALLYCTADDFNPDALRGSMAQRHEVTTIILDDSSDHRIRQLIDTVADETGTRVVRRASRTGFKAGNLNHCLAQVIDDFDYFVILDSDEVIPPHFVDQALDWFARDSRIGIVQAAHQAWRGETAFTAAFSGMLGSHIAVAQPARSQAGFSSFMGRGAMISAECYRAAGPIPELVIEDVAFSLEARLAGFEIAYDRELVSMEDYPIDYHAFRSQHVKLVEGTTEFLRRSWRRILVSPLHTSEKADLLLEQLMVPLLAFSGLLLIVAGLLLTILGGAVHQPLWTIGVTGICAAAPLLPETVRLLRQRGPVTAAGFLALASALYSSTLLVTLRATSTVSFGRRATFRVTPKAVRRGSRWGTLLTLRFELGAAIVAVLIALTLSGNLMPALPIAGPVLAALGFAFLGARSLAQQPPPATATRHRPRR